MLFLIFKEVYRLLFIIFVNKVSIMKKAFLFLSMFFFALVFSQKKIQSLNGEHWMFKNKKDNQWLPATVPGTVHTDLMANHKIPDPYLDENEKKVQWIEKEDWDYQTRFQISENDLKNQNIELVFKGLDTYAEIILNGNALLSADNMFREWKIPVKKYLKKGENTLQIRFRSAIKTGEELAKKIPFELPETPRSLVRKAQYQFGWDWGPRLVTAGIWKDVNLNFWNNAQIQSVQVEQKTLNNDKGELSFNLEIENTIPGKYQIQINENTSKQIELKKGLNKISIPYTEVKPQWWQPNGWGEAKLYSYQVKLKKENEILDTQKLNHGFRTVELVQEKDAAGKSFYFKVNGKPLYIKGTNWIPGDSFLPRITKEKYWHLIKDAKNAHMNMIRIWGGGTYEDDEFYNACDAMGILVWQDFMFAGSFYPSDEAFLNNVKEEVSYQAKRLQNHPSLALWCGNNEIDEAIINWGYQKAFNYSKEDSLQVWKDYRKVFHEVIPQTLDEVLPANENIYWPSSPSIGWGHKESLTQGDSHYWGVWHGEEPFEVFNKKVGRFMSEYGFQGMPSVAAVKAMFSETPELSLKNPVIQHHQKHARGWEIINTYMERDYVVPKDFVQYDYVSQLLQARGMQMAIEAHRRNQPYNMGTLIWQLNDCWPVVSWSAIDYLGNWKALQYQTVRSFAPQVIFAIEENQELKLFAINDELSKSEQEVQAEVKVMDFEGNILKQFSTTEPKKIEQHIAAFSAISLENYISKFDKKKIFLKLILKTKSGEMMAENTYFFTKPKDLELLQPNIKVEKISDREIAISTDVLAKNVYLMGNVHYSDNFFDLLPGERKVITSSKPISNIEIMSLYDTMQ